MLDYTEVSKGRELPLCRIESNRSFDVFLLKETFSESSLYSSQHLTPRFAKISC